MFGSYIHVGDMLVSRGEIVERGKEIALMFEVGKHEWSSIV